MPSPAAALDLPALRDSEGARVLPKEARYRTGDFCNMRPDAEKESGPRWATRNDNRTLRIGALMRRWSIDELPQFWNVLKGDVSLVGPRPELPELIKRFREEILYYNARHNIIPGMTGWAQANGFRGDRDINERILDSYFIENHPRLPDHVYDLLPLGRSTLSLSVTHKCGLSPKRGTWSCRPALIVRGVIASLDLSFEF